MWTVERPELEPEATYTLCISGIRDQDLRARLEGIREHIAAAAAEYADRASTQELHRIAQSAGVGGSVTAAEMIRLYDRRMAGKRGPGRRVYDAIRSLPRHGICPFCDHGVVTTLDHILPKALYPTLAVNPDNLVGACKDCNKAKQDRAPTVAEEAFLHPYFDDVSNERWLAARVVQSDVPSIVFHTVPVDAWPAVVNTRIRNQFRILGLGSLYSSQAAREISGQRLDLIRVYEARGEIGVREELRHKAGSWESHRLNCWQAAAFRAMSDDEWFCSEGFSRC